MSRKEEFTMSFAGFKKQINKANQFVSEKMGSEKQFGIKYSYKKELITIDFHYGYWNEHDWPQHV